MNNDFQIEVLHSFIYQKMGEEIDDCQDSLDFNFVNNRFCVADGVSRSFYPAIFSKQLTYFFCHSDYPDNTDLFTHKLWHQWLKISQKQWLKDVQKKVDQTNKYYIKNRFYNNEHAGATFAGIEFHQNNQSILFDAMIIGDSCLFHFDQSFNKKNQYLIQYSTDFNFTPHYFPSRSVKDSLFEPKFITDRVSINDIFIIATDAVSKWLLLLIENAQKNVLKTINSLSSETVDQYRTDQSYPLENDDIALLVLKVINQKNKKD